MCRYDGVFMKFQLKCGLDVFKKQNESFVRYFAKNYFLFKKILSGIYENINAANIIIKINVKVIIVNVNLRSWFFTRKMFWPLGY